MNYLTLHICYIFKQFSQNKSILLLAIPLVLSAFTHLWNPVGFPSLHIDEGHYLRKTMSILEGTGLDPLARYAAPYFGQIFLAGVLGIVGYPDSLNPSDGGDVLQKVETLYLVPRVLMGLLAVVDTFLIYKITERRYHNKNVALIAAILFAIIPVFTMIPLVGFIIYNNSSSHKLRNLGLWFIPVLLIPLIWPAHAMIIGEFDLWVDGVLWQTSERPSRPLIGTMETFFEMDP